MPETIHRTYCSRMDHGGCGLLVTVRDGRAVRVQGDPESPLSLGYLCPKGRASLERMNHPDRLLHPLMRDGERGAGKWKRVGWPEALDLLAGKIREASRRKGPESVLFGQGTPKGIDFFLLLRLANALGSPNVAGHQNICHMPREISAALTCGFWPEADYDHPPACIVLWGSNLEHTNEEGTISSRLRKALNEGARLVVVDPRPTRLARKADLWLRLRPGTDAALALGMMRVILDEGLENREFVGEWTVGLSPLRKRLEEYTPERVEELTWVPAEQVREAARLYAGTRPAAIQWGNALEHNVLSHQNCRALISLMALTGNLEVPGGNYRAGTPPCMSLRDLVLPGKIPGRPKKMLSAPWSLHPMLATVPPQLATGALLDGDPTIEVLYLSGTNPLLSYPDSRAVEKALRHTPFLAVSDLFLTPTAALADLVLPAATNFEFNDIGHYGLPHGYILARPKLVDPPGEARPDLEIILELGRALGLEEFPWKHTSELLDAVLTPAGTDYRTFREQGILWGKTRHHSYRDKGFKTPSGKVELYSEKLAEMGLDPLPSHRSPREMPELSEDYPFLLTSAKSPVYFHSAYRQLPSLRKLDPDPTVELAPETARSLGLTEGDWVHIRTPKGQIRQKVRLHEGLDRRVAVAAYGWWFPERDIGSLFGWDESNLNVLTSGEPPYDAVVGSVNLRAVPCALEPETDGLASDPSA